MKKKFNENESELPIRTRGGANPRTIIAHVVAALMHMQGTGSATPPPPFLQKASRLLALEKVCVYIVLLDFDLNVIFK